MLLTIRLAIVALVFAFIPYISVDARFWGTVVFGVLAFFALAVSIASWRTGEINRH